MTTPVFRWSSSLHLLVVQRLELASAMPAEVVGDRLRALVDGDAVDGIAIEHLRGLVQSNKVRIKPRTPMMQNPALPQFEGEIVEVADGAVLRGEVRAPGLLQFFVVFATALVVFMLQQALLSPSGLSSALFPGLLMPAIVCVGMVQLAREGAQRLEQALVAAVGRPLVAEQPTTWPHSDQ